MNERQDIAVVGRACRLPGAPSIQALWSLLSEGRCAVTQIPSDRWSHDRLLHPRIAERGKTYTFAAGVLDDIWGFDPGAFGMSPREAEQMDPQQRLLLELTWESLEDAGIRPSRLAGTDTGVFVGVSAVDHSNLRLLDMASADAYMMTGNTLSVVANRLSYIFDLHGPSFIVDTACSSALVALNEAVVNLRAGRIETALVGGVSILASPQAFVGFSQAAMLSRRGLCQAFSANADGYVRAEGGAVLVLKTREAAERDGDAVHAYITGADVNSDGRTNGISLPSKGYQAKLLERLYIEPGLDLDALAFFEAHGTGTPVGDPIEATAIGETVARRRSEPLLIGSIKTNIGHMEAASGLGGVLKAMLALEHDLLPPSLHSAELNSHIDFEALNLAVAREATPLPRKDGRRRLAGVNSFGFGGTNAHVVLADGTPKVAATITAPPPYLVISAHSRGALAALVVDYAARIEQAEPQAAAALMSAAVHRRDRLPHRVVVPVTDAAQVVATLDRLADEAQDLAGAARGTAIERSAPVCFVFSGNGSQFAGMGLAAYAHNADFREKLDEISRDFAALAGWSIVETLNAPDLASRLELTQISQPLLFAIQSATAHALRRNGLVPDFVVGHSVGEVAAAEAAGILDSANALKTIFSRSLHQELTQGAGGMAVVIGSREATDAILAELPDLSIAACNSPRAFTVSGRKADVARLSEFARAHKARIRKLDLDYPFHSALMAPVEAPLLQSLANLHRRRGDVAFVSTVTGTILDGESLDATYWWRNVREPVLFSDAVTVAVQVGARIFVEIGPAPTLLSHINDTIDERTATIATLPTLDKRDKGADPIAIAVATAIARGAKVDEARAYGAPPTAGAVELPHYPWQRKTYRLGETTENMSSSMPSAWHPLIGARYSAERLEWHSSLDTISHPSLADHNVDGRAILPGAAFAEMALAVARDWLGTEAATIADLEITSPMQLGADAGRDVLCRLSPSINHLEILSRPRLGQTPWQTHATAKILRDASVGGLPAIDDVVPLTPSHSVTGAEIYAMADRAGLHYGATFRKLERATAVRPDRIMLDLTGEAADPAYGVDPARLDSCFHALVLIFNSLREAVHGTAYIPVRFGEVMLRKPGATFVRGRIDVLRRDERIIIANFLLVDEEDEIVLFIREARFQAIRTARGGDAVRKMIYATTTLAAEPTAARGDRAMTLAMLRQGITPALPHAMSEDFVLLEGWATSLALQTAGELATANVVDVDALVLAGRLPEKLRSWLDDVLISLERSGFSHRDPLGRHIDPDAQMPAPEEILRTIAHEHQNLSAELLVAASTVTAVRAIEAGQAGTLSRSIPARILDGYELGSSRVQASSVYLTTLLRRSTRGWPRDRAVRLLQIGFGPLTAAIIKLADEMQGRLTILDPDRRRLERARIAFADRGDIEFIDRAEDIGASDIDLAVAAEALHRCHRIPGFLANLRRSLAPGAILAAVEPSPSLFRDLSLGLDARLAGEGDGLSVGEADWLDMLQSIGLVDAQVLSVDTADSVALLLTAQVEAERRSWSGSGTALIVGGDDARSPATVSALSTLLASAGLHVTLALDEGLDAGSLVEAPAFVIVFLQDPDAQVGVVRSLTAQCMALKRLVGALDAKPTTLWLVTSGALTARGDRGADVAAGLWAFSRTLANEVPTLDVRRVDVDDDLRAESLAERLRDLVLSTTTETEIVLGKATTRVLRFENGSSHERGQGASAEAARLRRGDGSGFDRLHWDAVSRQRPGPADVEIKVEAIGLNFRDVMFGLGLLPEDILEHGFAGPTLGLECAGRIERIGTSVKGFKIGDRVMAFAKNAFSTHVTTPAVVVSPIADALSFEAAATVPVAFLTAYHALMLCARLKPAEWVLIHGGAGGVGLAAIQIARWRGARVIATAGSPERRELLTALGAEHVFDSRTGAFVEDVRRVTGEGVGVVVNSLSGEAMERSIAVLRPFGRFVELGKRDYVANTHIGLRPFRRNLSYYGVDLDQLLIDDPATSKVLLRSVMRLFARGELSPLPFRVFDAAETAEAYRLMQQSGHVGKLVVRPPAVADITVRARHAFQVSPDKIHLITGGFGGFGIETARWLVARGARHLMLMGRSGATSAAARAAIAELAVEGVRVRAESIDITDRAALQRVFGRFGRDLPQLGGVIHAAMVLDDAMIGNVTPEQIERVLRPKIAGADHLDGLTRDLPLDYFVMYSSATTLIGNPGQGAYVAANGYLEGLARRRRRAGLPGLAIAWGAIEDVGVLARADATREALATRMGIKGMIAQDALRLMGQVLGDVSTDPDDAVVAIAPITWSAARQHLAVLKAPAYRKLASQDEGVSGDKEKIDIADLVAKNSPDEARKLISGLIVDEIARVLRLPREDVARTTPLSEIGLDSLMAVELGLGLQERFILDAPISATASSFTVNELADHIIGLATGTLSEDEALTRTMMERHLGTDAIAEIVADKESFERTADLVRAKSQALKGVLD